MIVVFGECMGELSGGGVERRLGVGGDTFNTALYMARLGLPVAYATSLGERDPISELIVSSLEHEGIDTSLIRRVPGRLPGLYFIETAPTGERRFSYWRDRAPIRDFSPDEAETLLDVVMQSDGFYFSGVTLAVVGEESRRTLLNGLRNARGSGIHIAFDTNYRPVLWPDRSAAMHAIDEAAALSTYVSSSSEDLDSLFQGEEERVISQWAEAGAEIVLRTRELVSRVHAREGCFAFPARPSTPVVDTTGAGDSYNAGYLASRLRGGTIERAVGIAQALAARVVRHPGAIIPASEVEPVRLMLGGA